MGVHTVDLQCLLVLYTEHDHLHHQVAIGRDHIDDLLTLAACIGLAAENIRLGKKDATDEEVLFAAKLANCDEFASKMPNGYNTEIGENGCNLSGGERQRISIARAFLKNAPIILLDEATASLDVENETLIQTALSRLIKDKTVIVIAHRMRTVENADKIIVLANGTVAESGTPNELMNKNGLFRHMVERQTASQNWTI